MIVIFVVVIAVAVLLIVVTIVRIFIKIFVLVYFSTGISMKVTAICFITSSVVFVIIADSRVELGAAAVITAIVGIISGPHEFPAESLVSKGTCFSFGTLTS